MLLMDTLKTHWLLDGPRYFVDGTLVRVGDALEAELGNGHWTLVRFDCCWDRVADILEPQFVLHDGQNERRLIATEKPCRWPTALNGQPTH